MQRSTPVRRQDRGSVLPLVLVMSIVIAVIITTLANYIATSLRYSIVVEERADRLAAADGGLRYAIERLGNSAYAGCLSNLGNTGFTIDFPVQVNEADVEITCSKGSNGIGDIKSWALIITGQGLPAGQPMLSSQGGAGKTKLLGGPVWVNDPHGINPGQRTDLKAPVEIEDGDLWYYRPDCSASNLVLESALTFSPAFRGPICVEQPWTAVYETPVVGPFAGPADVADTNPPALVDAFGCTILRPGRYTAPLPLGTNTYLQSGNYYIENVLINLNNVTVTAGWPDFNQYGDQIAVANAPCADAISADSTSGSLPGATLYLGGSSRIEVDNKGSIEVMRRLQGDTLVSIQAIETTGPDRVASILGYSDRIIWTKSGNNSDLALHGALWAPLASIEFGNVTNAAQGQLLGGAAVATAILQSAASASGFIIRVEGSPIAYELRLDSTATKNGQSTTMTAVVQVDDQGTTAVRSVRVRD